MKKSNHQKIRTLLTNDPTGFTSQQISLHVGMHRGGTYRALKAMVDVYVSKWEKINGKYQAVYKVVKKPQDAPKPVKESNGKTPVAA